MIVLIGRAGGTLSVEGGVLKKENKWETPAAWLAEVRKDGRVYKWQIYVDNEPIREKMRKAKEGTCRRRILSSGNTLAAYSLA